MHAFHSALTPVELHRVVWMKRDDLYLAAGAPGGKARTCWGLSQGARGLVTASSRQSPQIGIVARCAAALGIACRVHVPWAEQPDTPEMAEAKRLGATVVLQRPGYNSVIVSRARLDAIERGWKEIPFGMECVEAVMATKTQVANLPWGKFERIVVPVGSGMSLCGILHGLMEARQSGVPVLGIQVGASPAKRLARWAPAMGWAQGLELRLPGLDYHAHAKETTYDGVLLDPVYEAKCIPFLQPGDLLWVVGIRGTALK